MLAPDKARAAARGLSGGKSIQGHTCPGMTPSLTLKKPYDFAGGFSLKYGCVSGTLPHSNSVPMGRPHTSSSHPRQPDLKVFLFTLPCPLPFSLLEAKAQSLMHSSALLWVGTLYARASMSLGWGKHVGRQPLLLIKFTELQGLDFVTSDYSCRSDSHTNFLLLK